MQALARSASAAPLMRLHGDERKRIAYAGSCSLAAQTFIPKVSNLALNFC
jgi:hypothetical protein